MSTEQQPVGSYGYASDEVKQSTFSFGGNFGKTFLKKFEYIPNGGKDGAEGDAIDAIFSINGTDKNYRMFPVTKAFLKDNKGETTDPNTAEMKDAFTQANAVITHILHCFKDVEAIKAAMARPINSYKEFAQLAMSVLPKDYSTMPLDIFLQFQYKVSEGKDRTYLDIPKVMKHGKWLSKAIPGNWKAVKKESPEDTDGDALHYENEKGEQHIFVRSGWFMNSNFANQIKPEGDTSNAVQDNTTGAPAPAAVAPSGQAVTW